MIGAWDLRAVPRPTRSVLLVACAVGLALALYPLRSDLARLALLGVIGVLAFVGSIRWPRITAVALVLTLVTSVSDVLSADSIVSLNLVAIGGALAAMAATQRRRMVDNRVVVLLLVYAAVMLLSSVGAADPARSERASLVFLREIAIACALLNLVQTLSGLRMAAWAVAGAGALLAAASVIGFVTGHELGGFARLYYGTIVGDYIGPRVGSTTGDPNVYGQILVLAVPFALCAAWNEDRLLVRVAALACFGLLALTTLLTFSRGALLGLAIVLVASAVRQRTRRWIALGQMLVVLVVIGLVVPMPYWDRLGETARFVAGGWNLPSADASLSERSRLWRVGALMFIDHPVTGVGMDNYALRYQDYYAQVDPNLPCCPMGAHALPVRVLAETGVLGLAALTAIVVVALRGVRRVRRRLRDAGREPLWPFDAIEIGLLGFLVSGLFLDGQYMRPFWVVLALALAARRLATGCECTQRPCRPLAASGFTQA